MKYYVWLEYYAAAPVSKNIKSDELKYYDGHHHGVQPSQVQVDSLQLSLIANVTTAYTKYNAQHPTAPVAVPSNATIAAGRTVNTRSEH
jgi:hypothetical protein